MTTPRVRAVPWGSLIPVLLALVALVAVALASIGPVADSSSTGTGTDGTAAAYDWLNRLGYDTSRLTGDIDNGSIDTLIINQPSRDLTDDEMEQVARFVRAGGNVVIATSDPESVLPLLSAVDVQNVGETSAAAVPLNALATSRVHSVDYGQFTALFQSTNDAETVLITTDGDAGLRVKVGSGDIWILGSGDIFDNAGLRNADNGFALLTIVETGRGGRIAFDDAVHGVTTTDPQTLIFRSPLGLGILVGLLAILIALATGGRRIGRAVPEMEMVPIPTAAAYVESMAHLFERSARRSGVVERYVISLRAGLAKRYFVDPQLDDNALLAALADIDEDVAARAGQAFARAAALNGREPSDSELVGLAAAVDDVTRDPATAGTMTR